jgi:tetratricopeptide (TPR) repeat protein
MARCALLFQASLHDPTRPTRVTSEAVLAATTSAYALIPPGRAPGYATQLALRASVALRELGRLESSPTRLSAAIDWAEKAALAYPDYPQAAGGWNEAAVARICRAELWAGAARSEADAQKRREAREELQKAIDTLTQRVAPYSRRGQDPNGFAVVSEHLGLAHRLQAELAESAAETEAAYRAAAGCFRAASETNTALGDTRFAEQNARNAAACENLAAGVAQAGGRAGGG